MNTVWLVSSLFALGTKISVSVGSRPPKGLSAPSSARKSYSLSEFRLDFGQRSFCNCLLKMIFPEDNLPFPQQLTREKFGISSVLAH